uniref:Peptidase A1 domain-containing protein n=1 Tax=Steinernema glaseri TaxID=37863 RepID=A0A1I7YCM6_9BILA
MGTTVKLFLALALLDLALCAVFQVRVESAKPKQEQHLGKAARYVKQPVPVASRRTSFTGNITFGSENHVSEVYFDTGSSETWIVDKRCWQPKECSAYCYIDCKAFAYLGIRALHLFGSMYLSPLLGTKPKPCIQGSN